jgi:zinc transporter ZupT
MTALVFAIATFVSTALGGLFALHRRRHLYLVMGAAAGLLIGSALLDLLPDALGLVRESGGRGVVAVLLAALAGFLAFLAVDQAVHSEAAAARKLHLSSGVLACLLGFFAGTFLFVGAAHLLPEAAREGRKGPLVAAAVAGVVLIGAATWILGG